MKTPRLVWPYCFHVLLHEYIHSLGFLDENITRELTLKISSEALGKKHCASMIAKDIQKFFPCLMYSGVNLIPKKEPALFIVQGFDKGNLDYLC